MGGGTVNNPPIIIGYTGGNKTDIIYYADGRQILLEKSTGTDIIDNDDFTFTMNYATIRYSITFKRKGFIWFQELSSYTEYDAGTVLQDQYLASSAHWALNKLGVIGGIG